MSTGPYNTTYVGIYRGERLLVDFLISHESPKLKVPLEEVLRAGEHDTEKQKFIVVGGYNLYLKKCCGCSFLCIALKGVECKVIWTFLNELAYTFLFTYVTKNWLAEFETLDFKHFRHNIIKKVGTHLHPDSPRDEFEKEKSIALAHLERNLEINQGIEGLATDTQYLNLTTDELPFLSSAIPTTGPTRAYKKKFLTLFLICTMLYIGYMYSK